MKRVYTKVFRNPEVLQEMLYLRHVAGWSYPDVACRYGVDHTSIMYHVKKTDHDGYVPRKVISKPTYTERRAWEKARGTIRGSSKKSWVDKFLFSKNKISKEERLRKVEENRRQNKLLMEDRIRRIKEMRGEGIQYSKIGIELGITTQRVCQLYKDGKKFGTKRIPRVTFPCKYCGQKNEKTQTSKRMYCNRQCFFALLQKNSVIGEGKQFANRKEYHRAGQKKWYAKKKNDPAYIKLTRQRYAKFKESFSLASGTTPKCIAIRKRLKEEALARGMTLGKLLEEKLS